MKSQRTTKILHGIVLCILALSCSVYGGGSFLDDFSDGDIQDGAPVSWQWESSRGQCAVSSEGLELSPAQVYWSTLGLYATDKHGANLQYSGDITVRAQFNLGSATHNMACIALVTADHQPGSLKGLYFLNFNPNWFFLSRDEIYRADWHWSTQGRFNPTEDIIIQLDLIDITGDAGDRTASRLECRWWAAGQEMPEQAQIVGVDSTYDVSSVMLGALTDSVEGSMANPVVFRWIEVTGTQTEPMLDFNGNGTVDIKDLTKLIESWGLDDPAVDIVPDGVVDENDLEVLMDYWQQDVNDRTLLAHWKLDETEGMMAQDSAEENHALVIGAAQWQPETGQVQGTLALDGSDDFIATPFILDPSETTFSVFAWVKGGTPGQVILSQTGGVNWLATDESGCLFTDLAGAGRNAGQSLYSDTIITDGQWHRIGLVWDCAYRSLYVDDQLVATDATPQDRFPSAIGGFRIGAGDTLDPGTLWHGLVDDVRVYNRIVKP